MTPTEIEISRPFAVKLMTVALKYPEQLAWGTVSDEPELSISVTGQSKEAPKAATIDEDGKCWASFLTVPMFHAVPDAAHIPEVNSSHLRLLISMDIKGVLQIRAWSNQSGALNELKVIAREHS